MKSVKTAAEKSALCLITNRDTEILRRCHMPVDDSTFLSSVFIRASAVFVDLDWILSSVR